MGTIIRLLTTINELEEKKFSTVYATSTTQRCPKEKMQIFLIEDFFQFFISP
jgi:hypothetical protein